MKNTLKKFLDATAVAHSRCTTCKNIQLAREVVEFLDARAAGQTPVSFQRFYERHVALTYPGVVTYTPFRLHAVRCLGRDIATGKKLAQ